MLAMVGFRRTGLGVHYNDVNNTTTRAKLSTDEEGARCRRSGSRRTNRESKPNTMYDIKMWTC
jgi:hypothetical protein